MTTECVRDSFIGQCLRQISNKPSWLKYDEEHIGCCPKEQERKYDDDSKNTILVDWYSDDDKENPRNWSQTKKAFVTSVIGAYSFVVYMSAPIYTPSENAFISEFGVNAAEASLGLALYVYVDILY